MDIRRQLEKLGSVPFSADVLKSMMRDIKAPDKKLSYMERQEDIIRLKRGLYIVSPEVSRVHISTSLVANHLYGPSYVSCLTALRHWGMIPEQVYSIQSITTKRSNQFDNSVGRFEYLHVDVDYYPIGVKIVNEDNLSYLMASPEKALCDLIVTTPYLNMRYRQELLCYLEEDLRLDMDEFRAMDASVFEACATVGKKSVLIQNIANILRS